MALLLPLVFALQTSITIGTGDPARRDSTRPRLTAAERDSVRREREAKDSVRREVRRAARRIPLTPAILATAFADTRARDLFERAKRARLEQDSTLLAYDATAHQRVSAGIGFKRIGRDRLLFRTENVSRIRWSRSGGAFVDLIGARTAVAPFLSMRSRRDDVEELAAVAMAQAMSPIPYFPGRESLLPIMNNGVVTTTVEEDELIHPLAAGAEAYYRYEVGDSASLRLPGGRIIRLVELRVRARKPQWNAAIASLWFDAGNAKLVRAAYRFSEPMDIWKVAEEEAKAEGHDEDDDVPPLVKRLITPMTANVSTIAVEYGLYEERWWLPRVQLLEGDAQVGFMHVPFKMQESFTYGSFTGGDSVPSAAALLAADSARRAARDSAEEAAGDTSRAARLARDSAYTAARRRRREEQCAATGSYLATRRRYNNTLPVTVSVPCDTAALARAPQLPKSIYDEGEELFGENELRALREEALTLDVQPPFDPQPPELDYGAQYVRYNRVEGLSLGAALEQKLGAGYDARLVGRLGLADLEPNAELSLMRSDGVRAFRISGYRRLAAANDWGDPLALGPSLSAFLFGRDEGFYYRTVGGEISGGTDRAAFLRSDVTWRLFAEHQSPAAVETQASLPKLFNGTRFLPNIDAARANAFGIAARAVGTRGVDPRGLRLTTDLRAEAATGTFDYGRVLLDATVSRGLGARVDAALTLGAGTAGGDVPAQRMFYLGGSRTVRGQVAGAAVGEAFWLARAELAVGRPVVRPALFADLGWAGARRDWAHPGRPLSGVGVGASILDGLIRFDVARGIHPREKWRADAYLEARF